MDSKVKDDELTIMERVRASEKMRSALSNLINKSFVASLGLLLTRTAEWQIYDVLDSVRDRVEKAKKAGTTEKWDAACEAQLMEAFVEFRAILIQIYDSEMIEELALEVLKNAKSKKDEKPN